jgi:hypothetical protein
VREDPIVKETRLARARLFRECGEDLGRLMDHLKASEEQDRNRLVAIEDVRRRRGVEVPPRLPR